MVNLDSLDKQILHLLQHDAKNTHKEIAANLNLSVTATYERIKRLEKQGIIEKYVAIVDKEKLGQSLVIFCTGTLTEQKIGRLQDFENAVKEMGEIKECFYSMGSSDFLLKIIIKDMPTYHHFVLTKLSNIPNVDKLQSIVMSAEVKNETAIYLN
jgi:Lrp/AsnC family transcriptional regulator, leucine-responsive regulatory protein